MLLHVFGGEVTKAASDKDLKKKAQLVTAAETRAWLARVDLSKSGDLSPQEFRELARWKLVSAAATLERVDTALTAGEVAVALGTAALTIMLARRWRATSTTKAMAFLMTGAAPSAASNAR